MKSKLLLIIGLLSAITLTTNAQTEKGKSLINGSVGFGSSKTDNTSTGPSASNQKSNYFTVAPNYGYFISNNLAVGLGLSFLYNKQTANSTNIIASTTVFSSQIYKQSIFVINPFLRKYVDVAEKFKFFGHLNGGVGYGTIEAKNEYNYTTTPTISEDKYKVTSYNVALSPGFAFYPSKKWAIEFSFPLISYNKSEPNEDTNTITISSNESINFATDSFNPNIGFTFHF